MTALTDELNPKQREAVRLYTDPLLPTFGNKTQSALGAGYESEKVFDTQAVKAEVARIEADRARQGIEVREYMGDYALDAARLLLHHLSLGKSLSLEDPAPLLGPPTDEERETAEAMSQHSIQHAGKAEPRYSTVEDALGALVDGRLARAREITKANRVALQAAKESREAAELLLRHVVGHPEHAGGSGGRGGVGASVLDLDKLDHKELMALGEAVEDLLSTKRATVVDDDDPIVDAEWEAD